MKKKICPYCKTASYGSSDENSTCPKCKKDISHVPSQEADVDKLDINDFFKKIKMQRSYSY
jgi:hypothetical protein